MKRCIVAGLAALFLVWPVGCGGSDPEETPGDVSSEVEEVQPFDEQAPDIRDVRVELSGSVKGLFDLNAGDATAIVPPGVAPPLATVTVFAVDDVTPGDQLTVSVRDGEGKTLATQDQQFSNGLWKVSLEVHPGLVVGVEVKDAEGNGTTWMHRLIVPTGAEAILGKWDRPFYDQNFDLVKHGTTTFFEGQWSQEGVESAPVTGEYEVDGEELTLRLDDVAAANPEAPSQRVCAFFVDKTYFHHCPFVAAGEAVEIQGVWTRSYREYRGSGNSTQLLRDVTETLEFQEDGAWTLTVSGDVWDGTAMSPSVESSQGSYQVRLNENYIDNFGDFLVLEGDPFPADLFGALNTVSLFKLANGTLLIAPLIRIL